MEAIKSITKYTSAGNLLSTDIMKLMEGESEETMHQIRLIAEIAGVSADVAAAFYREVASTTVQQEEFAQRAVEDINIMRISHGGI